MEILKRSKLIDMDSSHLQLVLDWRNQEHIRDVMFHDDLILMENHRKWFEKIQNDKSTIVKIFYFDDKPLGVVNFTNFNVNNHTCYWGFYIGEKNSPKGLGTIMGYLALEYIFNKMKIRKLCAEIVDFNQNSIQYHKKLGFLEEGILKQHVLKQEVYSDVILMGLFDYEWEQYKIQIQKRIEGAMV